MPGGILPCATGVEAKSISRSTRRVGWMGVPHWDDGTTAGGRDLPWQSIDPRRPTHWGVYYSEWVANIMARFIDNAFHRGLLWRLPIRVVEYLPLLGLDFLLEGSPYSIPRVEQFLEVSNRL
jgi:hypothetical protein